MPNAVDFVNVSLTGLESSPVAQALAGLRANEVRYFMNEYKQSGGSHLAGTGTA